MIDERENVLTASDAGHLLHNPFFTGKIRRDDEVLTGGHEALIGEELFERAQKRMSKPPSGSEAKSTTTLIGSYATWRRLRGIMSRSLVQSTWTMDEKLNIRRIKC